MFKSTSRAQLINYKEWQHRNNSADTDIYDVKFEYVIPTSRHVSIPVESTTIRGMNNFEK